MYASLVPDDIQERLIQLSLQHTDISWELGDLTNETVEINKLNGVKATKTQIYGAVGSFFGKQARTIREYAFIAGKFNGELRQKYNVLSFDHFRWSTRIENPEEMLAWAVEQTDTMNRPATVDACIEQFYAQLLSSDIDKVTYDDRAEFVRIANNLIKMASDIPLSESQRDKLNVAIDTIKDLVEELDRAIISA